MQDSWLCLSQWSTYSVPPWKSQDDRFESVLHVEVASVYPSPSLCADLATANSTSGNKDCTLPLHSERVPSFIFVQGHSPRPLHICLFGLLMDAVILLNLVRYSVYLVSSCLVCRLKLHRIKACQRLWSDGR